MPPNQAEAQVGGKPDRDQTTTLVILNQVKDPTTEPQITQTGADVNNS
jgi:hypothetical protein